MTSILSLLALLYVSLLTQEQRYVLSVDVELVNVSATVVDTTGSYVNGLSAEDFRLLEDGREQKIAFFSHEERVPLSIGVLVDISGSQQEKLQQQIQILNAIAATLSPADEMLVITFNSRADLHRKFTNSRDDLQLSLQDLRTGGETAVYDAIGLGLREMQKAKHDKRVLLLLTDGFDTRSKIRAAQAEDLIKQSNVLVYAIGIDDDGRDPKMLKRTRYRIYEYGLSRLTAAGRGRLFRLYNGLIYDLPRLADIVLGELHQEYLLGYYPSAEAGGDVRSVEIQVAKPGARVLGEQLRLVRR